MRIHTLEATGGLTYAQMPRYASADGKGTNDATKATKGANGQPVDNPIRNLWVTETALTTALNTSYMAEQISLFGIVVGIALILSGIGFGILALAEHSGARRRWFTCRAPSTRRFQPSRTSRHLAPTKGRHGGPSSFPAYSVSSASRPCASA